MDTRGCEAGKLCFVINDEKQVFYFHLDQNAFLSCNGLKNLTDVVLLCLFLWTRQHAWSLTLINQFSTEWYASIYSCTHSVCMQCMVCIPWLKKKGTPGLLLSFNNLKGGRLKSLGYLFVSSQGKRGWKGPMFHLAVLAYSQILPLVETIHHFSSS